MAAIWRNASSRKKRFLTIVLFFILAVAFTLAGTLTPLTPSQVGDLKGQLDTMRENASVRLVFGNNMMICLLTFIPFVGPIFGFYVLYNTGLVIAAESVSLHAPSYLVLLLLFIFPFTWIEFIAYSTASAESVWLTWRLVRRKGRSELVRTSMLIAICTVLLFVAAVIEMGIIASQG